MIASNLEEGCGRAKQNAKAAENTYKRTVEKLNWCVGEFDKDYRPLLNKIQEADLDQIEFVKMNMQKFSGIIESIGVEKQGQAANIALNVKNIEASIDICSFISLNKS